MATETTMLTNSKNVEEQLFKYMMRGGELLDFCCPSCETPLIKEGETPDVMSPSALLASVSTTSFDGFDDSAGKEEDNTAEWEPIAGVPFCVSCEASVVMTEQELAYASERLALTGRKQKKGSMIVALKENGTSPKKRTTAANNITNIATNSTINVEDRVPSTSPLGLAPLVIGGFKSMAKVQGQTDKTAVPTIHEDTTDVPSESTKTITPGFPAVMEEDGPLEGSKEANPVTEVSTIDASILATPIDASAEGNPFDDTAEGIPVDIAAEEVPVTVDASASAEKEKMVSLEMSVNPNEETCAHPTPEDESLKDEPTKIEAEAPKVEEPAETSKDTESVAPEMDYKEKRSIATRVLGSKMLQGYTLQQIPCDVCSMPLMEKEGKIACEVCPALAAKRLEDAAKKAETEEKKRLENLALNVEKRINVVAPHALSTAHDHGAPMKNESEAVSQTPESFQDVAGLGSSEKEAPDTKPTSVVVCIPNSASTENVLEQEPIVHEAVNEERPNTKEDLTKELVLDDDLSRVSKGSKVSRASRNSKGSKSVKESLSHSDRAAAAAKEDYDAEVRERALLEKKQNIESSWEAERGALVMQLSQLEDEQNNRTKPGEMYTGRSMRQGQSEMSLSPTKNVEVVHRQAERDAQARTRLMLSLEHESSNSITSPSHESTMSSTPRTLMKWDKLRKKSRSEMSKRMMQGWTLSDECCEGRECYGMFLLSDRGRSMYCSVCQGSGTGVDGQYITSHSSSAVPRLTMPSQIQPVEATSSIFDKRETESYLTRHQQQRQDSESGWRSSAGTERRTPSLPPQPSRMSMSPLRPPRPGAMNNTATSGFDPATLSTISKVDNSKSMNVPRTLHRQNSDDDGNCSVLSDASSRAKSIASDALGMIMERIEKAKTQLVLPDETGSLSQGDLASQMEVAALIEKLASAAVAVRKLEELS